MNKPFLPLSREEIAIRALGLRRDPLAGELIALEPRMVFDGAGVALVADAAKQAADASDAAKTDAGKSTADAAAELAKTIAAAAAPMAPPPMPQEVVFIDSRVADIDAFRKSAGDNRLVVVVDAAEDGITKITNTLKTLHDISAVHIVGHGVDGSFELGKDWIGVDAIKSHDVDIKSWQAALTTDADILLYGCDVARTTKGEELIKYLAQETGADVAASPDEVGHTDHGVDWSLEKTTGTIEAKVVAPEGYAHEMAATRTTTPFNLVDDQRPNATNVSGQLTRSITYTKSAAIDNVTNDTTPTIRGEDGIVGATTKLYLVAADGTRQLVAAAQVNSIGGKGVYLLTYGTGASNVPALVDGGIYQFVVTQTVTGSEESPVADNGAFWVTIDLRAPTQFTSNDSAQMTTSTGAAITGNAITFNAASNNNLIRLYLTDQQVNDLSFTIAGVKYMSAANIRAGYLNGTTWDRATSFTFYSQQLTEANNLLIKDSRGYYVSVNPTAWFPNDTASHYDTKRVYFFLSDAAGNFTDARGNAPTTSTIGGLTYDAPVSLENALYLDVTYRVAAKPTIDGFMDDVGGVQSGVNNVPALFANNSVTDDLAPRFQVGNLASDSTLALTLNRFDSSNQKTTITVNPVNIAKFQNSDGTWTFAFDLSAQLQAGYNYTLTVKQTSNSTLSNDSDVFNFKIDTNNPEFTFADNFGAIQKADLNTQRYVDSKPVFELVDSVALSGTTTKAFGSVLKVDLTITAYSQTSSTGALTPGTSIRKTGITVTVKSDGSWTYIIPSFDSDGSQLLGNGLNKILVTVTDDNGKSITHESSYVYVTPAWTPGGFGTGGLLVWYDPSVNGAYTINVVNGINYVSSLLDLSGNGMSATQTVDALQPIYSTNAAGYKVVRFTADWNKTGTPSLLTATSDVLNLPGTLSPSSLFFYGDLAQSIVGTSTTISAENVTQFANGSTSIGFAGNGVPSTSIIASFLASQNKSNASAAFIGNTVAAGLVNDGVGGVGLWLNGTKPSGNSASLLTLGTIGSLGLRFTGDFGGLIAYSRALSTIEAKILSNAQSQRYGMTVQDIDDLFVVNGTAANGTDNLQIKYANDIGGIGFDGTSAESISVNGGLILKDSATNSFLAASGSSILFGNNGAVPDFRPVTVNNSDNPGVTRFSRSWAIDVKGGAAGGKVDLAFDVASMGAVAGLSWSDVSNLYEGRKGMSLAWRATESDPWQIISTSNSDVFQSNGKIEFQGVDVGANGLRDGFITLLDGPTVKGITRTNVAVGSTDTTATFRVNFSENVSGLTASSFNILMGDLIVAPSITSIGAVQTDSNGNFYSDVSVSYKNGSGYVGLDYNFKSVTGVDTGTTNAGNAMVKTAYVRADAAGLADPDTPSFNMKLDKTLLGIVSGSNSSAVISISFLEAGAGLGANDFAILDANNNDVTSNFVLTADSANPTGTTLGTGYKFVLTQKSGGAPDGQYKLALKPSPTAWQDASSNAATTDATKNMVLSQTFTVDTTPPSISSITRTDASGNTLSAITKSDVLTYKVTISKSVQNVDGTDFLLDGPLDTVAADISISVSAFAGDTSRKTYLVTLSDKSGKTTLANYNGSIGLKLATTPTQNIADTIGNALDTTLPTGTNREAYTVDNIAPVISGVSNPWSTKLATGSTTKYNYFLLSSGNGKTGDVEFGFESTGNLEYTLNYTAGANAVWTNVPVSRTVGTSTTVYGKFHLADQTIAGADFYLRSTDAAGNVTVTQVNATGGFVKIQTTNPVLTLTGYVDSVAPVTSTEAAPSLFGTSTNDPKPSILGTVDNYSTLFNASNGSQAISGTYTYGADDSAGVGLRTWKFTPTANIGTGPIYLSFMTIAPSSRTSSVNGNFTVDTSPPPAPVISGFADDVGAFKTTEDSPSASGVTTDDTSPLLVGTVTALGRVDIYEGTTKLGSATLNTTNGKWSYQLTDVSPGTHNYTAKLVNDAGNQSAATSAFTIKVDTSTVSAPSFSINSDTGSSQTDFITKDSKFNVSGVASGNTWAWSPDGGQTWSSYFASSVTSFDTNTINGTFAIGKLQLKQKSSTGVESAVFSNAALITIDKTPPNVTALSFTMAQTIGNTLFLSPDFKGLGILNPEANAIIEFSLNSGKTWQVSAGTNGLVTILPGGARHPL